MKKMLIDFSSSLLRIAVINDLKLENLIIENRNNKSLVSNIYSGVVKNILPSQFAFIDIGEEKNAFLQLTDNREQHLFNEKNKLKIKNGDVIPVQVIKDGVGEKGSVVSTELQMNNKYFVLMNNFSTQEINISKKISSTKKREALENLVKKILPKNFGIIIRTETEFISDEVLLINLEQLIIKFNNIIEKAQYIKGGLPIYTEKYFGSRSIKKLLDSEIEEVIVANENEFENIKAIINRISENTLVTLSKEKSRLFNVLGIETTIEKLLHKKIWLKSGGFLIIEETEAFVIIDVNTGKFLGKKNYENSILKLNLEASVEICKQIKLRNLSGMIIIDFISMHKENIDSVYKVLKDEFKKDLVSTNIVGMTKLGLMQITRKKTNESISNILQKKCTNCFGTGKIFSEEYIVDRIIKNIETIIANNFYNKIILKANKEIINIIKVNEYFNEVVKNNLQIEFEKINSKLDYFELEKMKI